MTPQSKVLQKMCSSGDFFLSNKSSCLQCSEKQITFKYDDVGLSKVSPIRE